MDRTVPSRRPLVLRVSSSPPPRNARREDSSDGESRERKRRRTSNDRSSTSSTASPGAEEADPIESIDLTEVDGASSLDKALAKQREDAVRAQQNQEEEKGRSVLTAFKCPVCMDTPVDATSTVCGMYIPFIVTVELYSSPSSGHLFCHKCIIDTLKFGEEQRSDSSNKPRGTCPVCRKPLVRTDRPPKKDLVPLQLQLKKRSRNPVTTESA